MRAESIADGEIGFGDQRIEGVRRQALQQANERSEKQRLVRRESIKSAGSFIWLMLFSSLLIKLLVDDDIASQRSYLFFIHVGLFIFIFFITKLMKVSQLMSMTLR